MHTFIIYHIDIFLFWTRKGNTAFRWATTHCCMKWQICEYRQAKNLSGRVMYTWHSSLPLILSLTLIFAHMFHHFHVKEWVVQCLINPREVTKVNFICKSAFPPILVHMVNACSGYLHAWFSQITNCILELEQKLLKLGMTNIWPPSRNYVGPSRRHQNPWCQSKLMRELLCGFTTCIFSLHAFSLTKHLLVERVVLLVLWKGEFTNMRKIAFLFGVPLTLPQDRVRHLHIHNSFPHSNLYACFTEE